MTCSNEQEFCDLFRKVLAILDSIPTVLVAKRKQNKDIDRIMTNFAIKSELFKHKNKIITIGTLSKANIRQICKKKCFKLSDVFAQDDFNSYCISKAAYNVSKTSYNRVTLTNPDFNTILMFSKRTKQVFNEIFIYHDFEFSNNGTEFYCEEKQLKDINAYKWEPEILYTPDFSINHELINTKMIRANEHRWYTMINYLFQQLKLIEYDHHDNFSNILQVYIQFSMLPFVRTNITRGGLTRLLTVPKALSKNEDTGNRLITSHS